MLVLTRKKDESIIIGGNIEVKVIGIEDGKVQIGIKAPSTIDIFRKELYKSIQEENIEAAGSRFELDEIMQIIKDKN